VFPRSDHHPPFTVAQSATKTTTDESTTAGYQRAFRHDEGGAAVVD
jgi:hypothetical protein